MKGLSFAHLREINTARCVEGWNQPLDMWTRDDYVVAIGGEVGESCNIIKKLNRVRDGIGRNDETPRELVAEHIDELADVVIYVDLFLASENRALFPELVLPGAGFIDVAMMGQMRLEDFSGRRQLWMSRLGRDALRHAGRLGDLAETMRGSHWLDEPAARLVITCSMMATLHGTTLDAAIVSKFNRTSEKHGMPHRLELA